MLLELACPISKAIHDLARRLSSVETELLPVESVSGRILGEDLRADRDSPASDVSAMDGYAVRYSDLAASNALAVLGESVAGKPAPEAIGAAQAMKVFTGASIPSGADTVIERELANEELGSVKFNLANIDLKIGRSIRKQGENIIAGDIVLPQGTIIDPSAMAALVSFASAQVCVRRTIRVSVINTGSELVTPGQTVQPWQIRDSNGPFLDAFFKRYPFVELRKRQSVVDDENKTSEAIADALQNSDVVLLTGGVSAGDYDFVPQVLKSNGVEIIFHRLPQKPGKPVLGGVGPEGQLVCGLPGNPVSVAVTARRIALPLIQFLAGCSTECLSGSPVPVPYLANAPTGPLVLYQLARRSSHGCITVDSNKGSGDLVSLGHSDGFVEQNPFCSSEEPKRNFYAWAM